MCLITNWKSPRMAKKDIVVFKNFDCEFEDGLLSPYQGHVYQRYELNITNMVADNKFSTYMGYAVLNAYPDCTEYNNPYTHVHEGFHAYTNLDYSRRYSTGLTTKCIIPKGSLYYKDKTGLIVSNQIIIGEDV